MAAGRAGTPSASAVSNDSDITHSEQWWLPQPHPSLDENHSEWRPAVPMAEALQCSVCKDLLKEAITAAECGHSYCYDCIDRSILVGGKANFCPVCKILLGPNPWEHHKLKYDFMLDSLVRKVFPRPKLDAALEARRLEREEATRQAKANLSKRPSKVGFARVPSSGQLAGPGRSKAAAAAAAATAAAASTLGAVPAGQALDTEAIEIGMFPMALAPNGNTNSSQKFLELPPLPKPYVRVPASVTLPALKSYLVDRLAGKKGEASRLPPIVLQCGSEVLTDDTWTVQDVQDNVWKQRRSRSKGTAMAEEQIMLIYYAAQKG